MFSEMNFQPRQFKSLAHSKFGTSEVWHIRSLAHSKFGTFEVWHIRRLAHPKFGTFEVWHIRSLAHPKFGTFEVWHIRSLAHSMGWLVVRFQSFNSRDPGLVLGRDVSQDIIEKSRDCSHFCPVIRRHGTASRILNSTNSTFLKFHLLFFCTRRAYNNLQ